MRAIDARERRRDTFEAALHGMQLTDDPANPASRGGGALRSFHERMKRRIGVR